MRHHAETPATMIAYLVLADFRPSHHARPLCGRIGRRDKLRGHLARRTEGRVVEGCQIFLTARLAASASRFLSQSLPGIERCLLASATIRLASTAKPSPPTNPAAMHVATTRSNTRRKILLSRNRSLRARENVE